MLPRCVERMTPWATVCGSREAADVLIARTGIVPDVFYLAAAAGDVVRLALVRRSWPPAT
jgi:hypothetical protein